VAAPRLPGRFQLPFVLAAALIAGGLGDPLVETIADTGIFGPGYHDTNHLGVLPALICGLVLTLEIALLRCLQTFRRDARDERDWLLAVAERFGSRWPLRDVPFVFVLQLGVVFAMEAAEQLLVGGKPEAGTAWLGGPVAFSLIVHALIAIVVTIGLAALTRCITKTLTTLVRIAFACIALPAFRETVAPSRDRRDDAPFTRQQSPHACQIGERAPPRLLAPA
jgi:hypothetical protein